MSDPDYLLSAMMDELLPQMILKREANTESRYADQVSIHSKDSYGNQTMTYEEKVKLFNAKRYLLRLNLIEPGYTTLADIAKRCQKHDLPLAA